MKRLKQLLVLAFITGIFTQCNTTYKYWNFSAVKETHKSIAIIPYELTIDPQSMPMGLPVEEFKDLQKEEASFIQNYTYAIFMKKADKGKYSLDFQNIMETNKLLMDSSYNYAEFVFTNPAMVARKCNVDVVLVGTIYRSNPVLPSGNYKNRVDIKNSVYDKDGKLIWEFYTKKVRGSKKSSIELSKKIMRKVARKFPYKCTLLKPCAKSVPKVM